MQRIQLKAAPPTIKNRKFELAAEEPLIPYSGVAAEYDVEIERWFGIMALAPGCFNESIKDPGKIVILGYHYGDTPIGKAVRFTDSAKRLDVDFEVNPNTQAGKDISSNLKHSIIGGLSVGFDATATEIIKVGEGARAYEVERVTAANLMEISVVVWPAIDGARVQQSAALSDDEAHPGARAELTRILGA